MQKCQCKKSAYVLWIVLIALFVLLNTANIFLMLYQTRNDAHLSGKSVGAILLTWGESLVLWGVIGVMIYNFRKSAIPRILFDEDKMILVLSRKDRREFTWGELWPDRIQISYVRSNSISWGGLIFVFPDRKRLLLPRRFAGYNELCQLFLLHGLLDRYSIKLTIKEQWSKDTDNR